jgi:hypothetical protein
MLYNSYNVQLDVPKTYRVNRIPKELNYINYTVVNLLNELFLKFINTLILKTLNWKTDISRKPPIFGLDYYCMVHSLVFYKYLKPRGMNHKYDVDIMLMLRQLVPRAKYYYSI